MNLSEALITGKNVQLGEAMSQGLLVTGLGLTIVFAVLILLMLVLYLFKVIFYKDPAKASKKAEQTSAIVAEPVSAEAIKDDMDEDELIAVLTAAVAASLNTSTYNLQIKSYRRVNNNTPAWNKAGVTETINNRF